MTPFPAYLFDLDGTLVDTAPDLLVALNRTLEHASLPTTDIELTRLWVGRGAKVMIEQAIAHMGQEAIPEGQLEDLFQYFLGCYRERIAEDSEPYPDVVDTLDALRERTPRLGVVTNKRQDLSMKLLRELDLYKYFNIVVGGDTLQVSKPEPQPILYACNELVALPSETLFVGDSQTDVDAARAAGCPVVCMKDGYNHNTPAEQLGADDVLVSFRELL